MHLASVSIPMILQISLWSGIVTLYLGIAGAVGFFSRRAMREKQSRADRLVAAGYSIALFLPASALVLATNGWPTTLRIALLTLGGLSIWTAYSRPSWVPSRLWSRPFAYRYLAGVMMLAAVWGLSQALAGPNAAPLLIAVSALGAGAASSGTSFSPQTN